MLCGGLAGALAQTTRYYYYIRLNNTISGLATSYPLDVARRRMQLGQFASSGSSASGMTSVLVSTYQEAGITRGLFRGMTINYLRAIPMTALSFSVYETMKQLMGMETGLKISD